MNTIVEMSRSDESRSIQLASFLERDDTTRTRATYLRKNEATEDDVANNERQLRVRKRT